MNFRIRISRTCIAAAVVLSFVAASSRAQVLDQVPSDAVVVIKVHNLKATSDKIAKFAEALGLAAVSPEFADPLGSMLEHMKIKEGLDNTGDLAFVVTKGALDGGNPEDALMLLMPVSDYKAFVGNFQNVKSEGAISTFNTVEGGTKEMHSAQWGKFAAITNDKTMLANKPAGLKLSALASREAKEKDAFIYANIPALAEKALPELKKAREQGTGEIDKAIGDNADAKQFSGVIKAGMGQIISVAEGYLRDATSASVSLHLNDEGLAASMMTEFKPGSYGGKIASQLKNTNEPLLGGLPTNRKFFAAGGVVNDPQVSVKVASDFMDPITKELAATESGKNFAHAIEAWKKSASATKSATFGYPVPTGALGADSILQSIMVVRGDSKAIADGQKAVLSAVGDFMKMAPKNKGAEMNFELTPGAKTVGNVKLDSYEYKMTMDEGNPQAQQAQQVMAFIYGPNGMGGTFGAVDAKTFILVQGGTDKLLQDAVKAAPDAKDTISETAQVKRVAAQMPAKRVMVEYVFLDNMITSGVKYAQGFGLPVKMQLPPNLPPIGLAASTEGTAMRFDAFVPTQLIQSVVAAGMQAFMQFQGGGQGGNGL
jgi:hypothetical protein